jgi:gliding motility-associated-like protein
VGCLSDTVTKKISVTKTPVADFNISTPRCKGGTISFNNLSALQGNYGTIDKWNWNLDNANIINHTDGRTVSSVYNNTGNYTISLGVVSSTGCPSPIRQKIIDVKPLPEPGFVLPEICLDDAVAQFTDTTKIADGSSGFTYLWHFNAGNPAVNPGPSILTSTTQNPVVRYNNFGNYEVTLKVTSSAGCVDSVRRAFTVNGSVPDASFVINPVNNNCSNRPVEIQNKSTVDFGTITKVEIYWDFGGSPSNVEVDDQPSPDKKYTHKYPEFQSPLTKNYQIRFRAFSGGVCVDEQTQTIIVNASPLIRFQSIPDICLNDPPRLIIQAVETAGLPGTGIYTGKGTDATGLFSPQLAGVGDIPIQYKFISSAGCVDSASQSIKVWDYPRISAGPDLFVLEEGQRKIDGATATGQSLQYIWSPPVYLSSTSILQPVIQQPMADQMYTLTVTGAGGCLASDEMLMKVLAAPKAPNTFTPNGDGVNDVWEIQNLKDYPGCIVEIYNSAGSLVFRSIGYASPWDGTWKGQKVPVGTYYYVIDPKNGRPRIAGYITVLR